MFLVNNELINRSLTEEELKEECDSILKKTQHVEKLIHKQLMSVQTLNLKAPNSYNHIRYFLFKI